MEASQEIIFVQLATIILNVLAPRCSGLKVPEAATNALNMAGTTAMQPNPPQANMPPIATQCFMLSNMFDPMLERDPNWDQEIRDDVIEECNKHGGVVHIYVDKASSQVSVFSYRFVLFTVVWCNLLLIVFLKLQIFCYSIIC